jgi:Holliday junction DNA helicase RuvA
LFHHVRGTLTHATPTHAILEAGGVGYELIISLSTHRELPAPGEECLLLAHFAVSEQAQALYGFATEAERVLFRALISVSGVGPATAMQILSGTTPPEFARAVETQDTSALKKLKGIGEKTAKRIILELQGAVAFEPAPGEAGGPAPGAEPDVATAARQALETLGLPPREAAARVEKVLEKEPDLPLEDAIRRALQ